MKTSGQLKEERGSLIERGKAITQRAEQKNRDLTDAETDSLEDLVTRAEAMEADIAAAEKKEQVVSRSARLSQSIEPEERHAVRTIQLPSDGEPYDHSSRDYTERRGASFGATNAAGKYAGCFPTLQHRVADLYRGNPEADLSLGKIVKGLATRDWSNAELEQRAMSGSNDSLGGVTIPSPVASQFIDKMRANTVLFELGAQTFVHEADQTLVARVQTDPTVDEKIQNAAFAESDIVFDGVSFSPTTRGILLKVSEELMMDSVNIDSIITDVLAAAMARSVDADGISLIETSAGNLVASAPDTWEDFTGAHKLLRDDNTEPSGIITNPADSQVLEELVTGDAANSAKNWLGRPPSIADLPWLTTTSCTSGTGIIGMFSDLWWGQRLQLSLEMTKFEKFANYQWSVRAVIRGCWRLAREDSFCTIKA